MPSNIKNNSTINIPDNLSGNNPDRFYRQLGHLLESKPKEINLDCSQLQKVTSAHINVLWQARFICLETDTPVRLISISKSLFRILKILDLYDLLVAEETIEAETEIEDDFSRIKAGGMSLDMEFHISAQSINTAITKLRAFLSSMYLPEIFTLESETVFYEIATNIRQHSQGADSDNIIFLAKLHNDKITMQFKYKGIAFDPTAARSEFDPRVSGKQRQTRGYGLAMINKMTDTLTYKRLRDGFNVLYVEKKWGGENV